MNNIILGLLLLENRTVYQLRERIKAGMDLMYSSSMGSIQAAIKWFAKANKKISAFSLQAQNDFYDLNIQFQKKSFLYLASLNRMVNVFQTKERMYPLLIGCGKFDIPAERKAVETWKSREPWAKVVIFENAGGTLQAVTVQAAHIYSAGRQSQQITLPVLQLYILYHFPVINRISCAS